MTWSCSGFHPDSWAWVTESFTKFVYSCRAPQGLGLSYTENSYNRVNPNIFRGKKKKALGLTLGVAAGWKLRLESTLQCSVVHVGICTAARTVETSLHLAPSPPASEMPAPLKEQAHAGFLVAHWVYHCGEDLPLSGCSFFISKWVKREVWAVSAKLLYPRIPRHKSNEVLFPLALHTQAEALKCLHLR